jgi:DNA-binding Lrp family transcriptional regulator
VSITDEILACLPPHYAPGVTIKQIAEASGYSKVTVWRRMLKLEQSKLVWKIHAEERECGCTARTGYVYKKAAPLAVVECSGFTADETQIVIRGVALDSWSIDDMRRLKYWAEQQIAWLLASPEFSDIVQQGETPA